MKNYIKSFVDKDNRKITIIASLILFIMFQIGILYTFYRIGNKKEKCGTNNQISIGTTSIELDNKTNDCTNNDIEVSQNALRIERLEKNLERYKNSLYDKDHIISLDDTYDENKLDTYSKNKHGYNIPFIEGEQVIESTMSFRGNIIRSSEALSGRGSIDKPEIILWEYIPNSPLQLVNTIPDDFVIYGGYENYVGNPTYVKDLLANTTDSYLNKNGVRVFWGYIPQPHGLSGVNFYAYKYEKTANRYFLLEVGKSVDNYNEYFSQKDAPIALKLKEELKKLADQLE
jgi:hypothetical protein